MSTSATAQITDLRPLTHLPSIILTTGPFVFLWSYLQRYVTRNGALPLFTTITRLNSIAYSSFSAFLAYALITTYTNPNEPIVLTFPILGTIPLTPSTLGYVYHLSKFYEYIDVLNLVLTGHVIHQHMAFHHLTMPYLTYFRIIAASSSTSSSAFSLSSTPDANFVDDWRVFALANCVHHTIMYAYFGGLGSWLRSIVPVTGYLQLLLGVTVDANWMWVTKAGKLAKDNEEVKKVMGNESTSRGIAILLLLRYAMLYWQELKEANEKKKEGTVATKPAAKSSEVKKDAAGRSRGKKRN